MANVPASSGIPTTANEKKANGGAPLSWAASDTMTLTGLLASMNSPLPLPAKARGMSICDGGCPIRMASTTTSGSSAATDPLSVISAVRTAHSRPTASTSRARLSPALATMSWPSQVVTPVESMPSLTTKSVAMNTTTGSPKPASTASTGSSPVAHSASIVRMATTPTDSRFQTKRTMTAPRMTRVRAASSTGQPRCQRWTGEPGPHAMPLTYQMTKKIVHATSTTTVYGVIIDTTVPIPADFRYRWHTRMMNGRETISGVMTLTG